MKLEGELREIQLIPKLIELSEARFTGAVRFENEPDSIIKIIYFKDGDVLSASTNDRSDSIDEILLRSSKVSREHIKQALAKRKESETLGDALLGLGFITKKELAWVRRVQLIGIIRSLQSWQNGGYTIVNDYLPKREEGTLFNLKQVIVEVVVTENDRSRIEAELGGDNQYFDRAPDGERRYRELGLNEDADRIFARVDGRSSAAEIAAGSAMDAFAVYKLLYAFRLLGVVVPIQKPEVSDELSLDYAAGADTLAMDGDWNDGQDQPSPPPPTYELEDEEFGDPVEHKATAELPLARTESVIRPPESNEKPIRPAPTFLAPQPEKKSRAWLLALIFLALLGGGGFMAYRYLSPQAARKFVADPVHHAAPKRAQAPPIVASAPPPLTATTESVVPPATQPETAATTASVSPTTSSPSASEPPASNASPAAASTPAVAVAEVPHPPAAKVSAADPRRDEYEARALRYAAGKTEPFAVQLAFLCEVSSLQKAASSGDPEIWFIQAPRGGKTCFRLFWGNYTSKSEAQAALARVPAAYREGRPVVVRVNGGVR